MKILYASNICSNKEFKKIFDICEIKPLQSIQKFNKLLCDGFIINGVDVSIITSAPVNKKMCSKIFWKSKREIEENIEFNYCHMINLPLIKFITLFFSSLFMSLRWCIETRKEKKRIVIYDAYYPIIANVVAIVAKMFNIKVIGLYTDLPKCMAQNLKKKNKIKSAIRSIFMFIDKISNNICNGYIILTEQMNEVVNKKNKPYIVIEGMVDYQDVNKVKNIKKYKDFTIMYAGGLYEKYGVKMLIEAVKNLSDVKLRLYGDGELVELLKTKYRDDANIFYGGTLTNNEILIEEKKCTLLINPRFSNEEYTKYSFPSKNMEYMASGTPLLTTKLLGMPKEYYKYVFFIKNESVDGIINEIENIKTLSNEELFKKGKKSQDFVIKYKNNIIQSKKIIDFLNNI